MKIRQKNIPPAEFQLAPMIDIVFLLLIFFIVTYQISEQEKDVDVAVPTSSAGNDAPRVEGEIVINVAKSGTITVSGKILSKEELGQTLEEILRVGGQRANSQPVRLRGDADCSWQTLVGVMDVVQKAGIWNISFATRQAPAAP
ncbi:MAG: ExbD/TolR family protein [Verrucomicrobiales bacterium]